MSVGSPPDRDDERVGYCRPPKHSQFKKGNRANPYGRGQRNRDAFAKAVQATHEAKVEIRKGNRTHRVPRREANVLSLFDKAQRGIVTAADRLLTLYEPSVSTGADGPTEIEVLNALPNEDGEYRKRSMQGGEASNPRPSRKGSR